MGYLGVINTKSWMSTNTSNFDDPESQDEWTVLQYGEINVLTLRKCYNYLL